MLDETQVNVFTTDDQSLPKSTTLADGSYVIVWQSDGQDGSGAGIYAQRYTAQGQRVGAEFKVNSTNLSDQFDPSITALDGGGFVVTWTDVSGSDGSGWGVIGQRFDASGNALGGEFVVNSSGSSSQYESSVAALDGGGFVVTWRDDSGLNDSGIGVKARIYDASGVALGAQFVVNSTTSNSQYEPAVTGLNGGGFVVAFRDDSGADGSGSGILLRRFDATGTPVGVDQVVNSTFNSSTQSAPAITLLTGGGFVVTFTDNTASDGSGWATYARVYDNTATALGPEFLVPTQTTNSQYEAQVASLSDGGFVIVWRDDNGTDGSGNGIFARQFDATGTAVGAQIQINQEFSGSQIAPTVTGLANGAYVVGWQSVTSGSAGDGSGTGIFSRIIGDPMDFDVTVPPELEGLPTEVTFDEADVNAGPQLIDATGAAAVSDMDSANFDGGQLIVARLSGFGGEADDGVDSPTQEQLGIRNQGSGTNQVGISGNDVSYEGTVVGTISSDGVNGANLIVDFNSFATAAAVEAVVENLTYANTSDDPVPSRQYEILLSDGEGGAISPLVVTVNVTPEIDGAEPIFGERQVNSYTPGEQARPAIAGLNDGGYVIVWDSAGQDGFETAVIGQRYDANGVIIGPEFRVSTSTFNSQFDPSVSALSDGGFIVTWTDTGGVDGSGWGVIGQRYDSSGSAVGGEIVINSSASSSQYESTVTGLSGGGFAAAWRDDSGLDDSGIGVKARIFDASGAALGAQFRVNTTTSSSQYEPSIVGLSGGGFVVTWRDDTADGSSAGVFGQVFTAAGALVGTEFQVNTNVISNQYLPSVAALTDGGFVVTWRDDSGQDGSANGVYAQRYDNTGAAVGGEFRVNENTSSSQFNPWAVGLDNGGFVVAWQDNSGRDGSGTGIFAQQYDSAGNRIDGEFQVNTEFSSTQDLPVVGALNNGNFVIAWESNTSGTAGDGSGTGVFHQLFGDPADFNIQNAPTIAGFNTEVTYLENDVNSSPQLLDVNNTVSLGDLDSTDFDGGSVLLSVITNLAPLSEQYLPPDDPSQDQFGVRNQGTGTGQIGVSGTDVTYEGTTIGSIVQDGMNGMPLEISLNANASLEAVETLLENLTYANSSDAPIAQRVARLQVSDGDGATSEPVVINIDITAEIDAVGAVFGERQVNSFTNGEQLRPDIAGLDDGSYVIVWDSAGQDGFGTAVMGQRYDASGSIIGPEFVINTSSANDQFDPSVAALNDGGFIVTWTDTGGADGSGWGVIGQRYDSSGSAVGGEIVINSSAGSSQYQSSVTGLSGGGFAAAWRDDSGLDDSGIGVKARIFDASGAALGAQFRVNTTTSSSQYEPSIVGLSGGGFVVTWRDDTADGSSAGVFGQVFTAAGALVGTEFQVNTNVISNQYLPSVAALTDGGFVVTWRDDSGQDGSANGVYAQRYDNTGAAVGGEFRVNENTSSSQFNPWAVGLDNGGFVVAWQDNSGRDGSGTGIFAQQYDSAGNRIDGEFQVNTEFSSTQDLPVVGALNNGNFVIAWESNTSGTAGDGSGTGIFHQIFGNPADFTGQQAPILDGINANVSFLENAVNATPQLLDANGAVAVSDADSANFDGGSLLVTRLNVPEPLVGQLGAPDDLSQDQLGIRNQGTLAGQIGVSGTNVSFAGTLIGSIVQDGVDGNALEVLFNSAATPDAVEALVENLTYGNTSDDPIPNRQFRVQLSDGDGGAAEPAVINVQVVAEQDGVGAYNDETQVNTYINGAQDRIDIATLSDGSYVIVWDSSQDNDGSIAVFGQRYDANGGAIGDEFRINSTEGATQDDPAVAALNDGGFIVTWRDTNGTDGSSWGIIGQRFDSSGNPAGGEIIINSSAASFQYEPSVTGLTGGGFVAAWRDDSGLDDSGSGIKARLFDATGTAVGTQFRVNTTTANSQFEPSIIGLSGGGFAVVWTDNVADGSAWGTFGQVFDAAGTAVGSEFLVNTNTASSQYRAQAGALSDGGFVVTWRDDSGQDGSADGVYAQRYDASGTAVGGEFRVNENTSSSQFDPWVVGLANGGFVIAWQDNSGRDGSGNGIFAQQYDMAGDRVDGEFQVNTEFSSTQGRPVVGALSNGNFVVAWESNTSGNAGDGDSTGIFQQIFGDPVDFSGQQHPQLTEIPHTVNFSFADAFAGPQVLDDGVLLTDADSADFDGGSISITYLRLGSVTDQLGVLNVGSGAGQIGVSGSNVTFGGTNIGTIDGSDNGANGAALTIDLNANANAANVQALVEHLTYQTTDAAGQDTTRWIGIRVADGDGGVSEGHAIQIGLPASVSPATLSLSDVDSAVTFDEQTLNGGAQIVDMNVDFDDNGSPGFNGGALFVTITSGQSSDQLGVMSVGTSTGQIDVDGSDVRYEGVVIGTINGTDDGADGSNLTIDFNGSANEAAIEALIENITYQNTSDFPPASRTVGFLVTDSVANTTATSSVTVNITPFDYMPDMPFGERVVNAFISGDQENVDVATLNDGGYVIVWDSPSQDGSSDGIFGQRYDADGNIIGPEFLVNTNVLGAQNIPSVASLSDGGFVISWANSNAEDGSGVGVFAQRYNPDGSRAGGEFQVNTEFSSTQTAPAVTGLAAGGFVITWHSNTSGSAGDGEGNGIFAQRYDASGTPLGVEFQVNTEFQGSQETSAITELSDGNFVVAWQSAFSGTAGDGSGQGVFAQIFNGTTGATIGGEIQLNTFTSGDQDFVSVTGLVGGGFVATWISAGQDGSSDGVYAQRFDNAGIAQGSEFLVNTATSGQQAHTDVAALSSGGFVITWASNDSLDSSGWGVFAQEYDAAGNAINEQFLVNEFGSSTQYLPAVSGLPGDNFVIAFQSFTSLTAGDGSGYGIAHKVFGDPADFNQQLNPSLEGLSSEVTFLENEINTTPALLEVDGAVAVGDLDSPDFDGGTLIVSRLFGGANGLIDQINPPDDLTQDQLGVRNQGNGAGQIGVSGSTVSFGGTNIGTITSDGVDGAALEITFNANATSAIIESVLENVTYANSSDDPIASRQFRVQVSDGDGGVSAPSLITVNVTAEKDNAEAIFGERQVNAFIDGDQLNATLASLSDGGYIITWDSDLQDGNGDAIMAQRYDANGGIIGPEFLVNTSAVGNQRDPAAAGLNGGGFVIAYSSDGGQDGSGTGVFAQRYNVDGTPAGAEFQVNTEFSSTQSDPQITVLNNGDFVIAWTSNNSGSAGDGSSNGVFAQRYDSSGTALGGEFQINVATAANQDSPSISATTDGGFVVVWDSDTGSDTNGPAGDGNNSGVFARRYDMSGSPLGGEFQVNTETVSDQYIADVAGLTGGGFVVTWRSNGGQDDSNSGIYAQRFNASGVAVDEEFRVNEGTSSNQREPAIVALSDGGFVITWADDSGRDGSTTGVFAQQYDANGNRIDGEFQVNTEFSGGQGLPGIAALDNGGFVIGWQSDTSGSAGDGSNNGIFHQIFGDPANFNTQGVPIIEGLNTNISFDENALNAAPQLLDPDQAVAITDVDSADFDGGSLLISRISTVPIPLLDQFNAPDELSQDQLGVRNVGTGSGEIGVSGSDVTYEGVVIGSIIQDGANGSALEIQFNANSTASILETLLENLTYANTSDDPIAERRFRLQLNDGDGGTSEPVVITINVNEEQDGKGKVGGERLVNSFTDGAQDGASIAMLSDGSYVIAWESELQDSALDGVYAQRYDANGVLVGPEFKINTTIVADQDDVQLAGLSGGGFVAIWRDTGGNDGSGIGIFGQRFDNDGNALGGEFQVNSEFSGTQNEPHVVGLSNGDFVVTWTSDNSSTAGDGNSDGIFLQRFNSLGVPQGIETQVNTEITGNQRGSSIAATVDGGGGFVVTWYSATGDGDSNGVFAQRYDNAGVPQGGEFLVNTETTNAQDIPSVAGLSGGGFVIAWESSGAQDGSGTGIYAQRFDASGNPLDNEFRVHEFTTGEQVTPQVLALTDGGFVVGWYDSWNGEVRGQQYDADGNRIDGEFLINTTTGGTQSQPALGALANGNFVAAWTSADASGNGVYQQLFGDPLDFQTQAAPIIEAFNTEITYVENDVNNIPQLLDMNGAVALSDADSADFDGGRLLVTRLNTPEILLDQFNPPDDLVQDNLGIRNEGVGATEIGVSGTDVTYGGTIIGTVSSNGQLGAALQVELNANATLEAVEALLENITYENISDDPVPSRKFRVQVSDGDGGTSLPTVVTVNITPTVDGAIPVFGERQANTTEDLEQTDPAIATLNDNSFVMVWSSTSTANGDGDSTGVFGQRFDSLGNAIGTEFQVNTQTNAAQDEPSVAATSDGGFVVIWTSQNSAPAGDSSGDGVFGQRYDNTGTAVGGEFQVNTETSSTQDQPDVVGLTGGGFVVTWDSAFSGGAGDGSSTGVIAQLFNASGVPDPAGEIIVNTERSGVQDESAVAALQDGGFIVVWTSATSGSAGDGDSRGVFAQRFNASGGLVGSEFQVNSEINDAQEFADVAGLVDGGFVITWESNGQDGASDGVFARQYASDGLPVAAEFRVNDSRSSSQQDPKVAALDTGGFAITWEDNSGRDGSGQGIFVQQYDAMGNRIDSETQVNTEFSSTQDQPVITHLAGGGFVVGWASNTSSTAGDGSGDGVFYQIYGNAPPVVTDVTANGFEDTELVLDNTLFEAGFDDSDGQALALIRIEVLPSQGMLMLDGAAVSPGDEISLQQLIDGDLTYLGNMDFFGSDDFGWRGSDGLVFSNEVAQTNLVIAPVNDAPGLEAGPDGNGFEGFNFSRQITLSDPDPDNFTYTVNWGDGSADTIFTTAAKTSNLNHIYADDGMYAVTVTVDDNSGAANAVEMDTFDVTIANSPPDARNDFFNTDEETAVMGNVLANNGSGADNDPGDDLFSITAVNGSAANLDTQITLLSGALLTLNSDGTFDYNPNGQFDNLGATQSTNDSFEYTITDEDGATDTATVNINISGLNDNPDAVDDDVTTDEDTPLSGNVFANNGNGPDIDIDGDNSSLTVTEVNGVSGDVGLQISLTSGALLTLNDDGTFDYNPNGAFESLDNGQTDTDTFTYTIEDDSGLTDTATVTVRIDGVTDVVVNNPPVAQDDSFNTDEDSAIMGDVFADNGNGVDDDPDGDTLSVTNPGTFASAGGGLVNLNTNGSFNYSPAGAYDFLDPGDTAVDTFVYNISDGNGGTDTATVSITIDGLNDAPVAVDDDITTDEDNAVLGNVLLDNGNGADSDDDASDSIDVTEVNGVAGNLGSQIMLASNALLTLNSDGSFDYNPNGQFETLPFGSTDIDSFTYTIEDSAGETDTATVTITVEGVNDAPVAIDDEFIVGEDAPGNGDVFAPGIGGADSDIDTGDLFDVSEVNGIAGDVGNQVTLSSGALLTLNSDGTFEYDPAGQFEFLAVGETDLDSFTYTIDDSNGGSDTATVAVTITGINDAPTAVDDDFVISEDQITPVPLDLAGGDTDPDISDMLSVQSVDTTLTLGDVTLGGGTVTYSPNGQFETLDLGASALDTFAYVVTDGNGGSDTATVTVTITGENDAPIAGDDGFTTDEDTPTGGNVLADNGNGIDDDIDANAILSVTELNVPGGAIGSEVMLPSGALLTLNTDGSFDYDPNGQFEGLNVGGSALDSFSYTLSDNDGATDTATVTITVDGVNDAPVAADDGFTTDEDTPTSGNVFVDNGSGADSDVDDALTVSAVNGNDTVVGSPITLTSGASLTLNVDGTFDYDPNGQFEDLNVGGTALDTFSYTLTDSQGATDTATVTITVEGVNDAPVAADDSFITDEDTTTMGNVFDDNGNGADADVDDALTVSAVNGDAADVGGAVTLGSGASLTLNANGTFDYDPNGAFESLNTGDTELDTFTYTLTDSQGETDTATVTVTINGVTDVALNNPPTAQDDVFSTDEDTALTTGDLFADNGNGVDDDPDGDMINVSQVNGNGGNVGSQIMLASGALLTVDADGTFAYDPNGQFESLQVGDTEVDSFVYTINDGRGGNASATATITISGVNDAPVAADDGFTTDEDTPTSGNVFVDNGSGADSDVDDALTVSAVNGNDTVVGSPITLTSGASLTLNVDGTFDYDPGGQFEDLNLGVTALDSFTYTIEDSQGATDTATVTITVEGVNDAPSAEDDGFTTDEDTPTSGNVFVDNGSGADSDVDDALTVSAVNGNDTVVGSPITLTSGASLTLNVDGTFDYDPSGQFEDLNVGVTALDSFTYTIEDSQGATDTATVTITVEGVNDAPNAEDDGFTTDEDTATSGSVFVDNGSGADLDVDDVLLVTAVNGSDTDVGSAVTLGSGASLTLNADGTFDYDPSGAFDDLNVGQTELDTFTYTVTDSQGASDTATVTHTVFGVNDAPVAEDDAFTTDEDTATAGSVFDDNGNGVDSDLDDALTVSAVNGNDTDLGVPVSLTSGASLTLNADGTFDYDPRGAFESLNTGQTDLDTFTYTIEDSQGETDTATVTVTIDGVTDVATNNPPTAQDDVFSTDEDTALTAGNLFADNGNGVDDDPDGDMISVSQVNGNGGSVGNQIMLTSGALLTVAADGTFAYDPDGQFETLQVGDTEVDSFVYTINDGRGGNASATATITISGVNDAPVAADDGFTTDEDTPTSGNVFVDNGSGADSDVDDALTVSAVNGNDTVVGSPITLTSGASLTLNVDGTFDYDPNGQFEDLNVGGTALDTFSYALTDSQGATDTATVTITVEGVNDAPSAEDDGFSTDEDTPTSGNVFADNGSGADADVDDALLVTAVNGIPGDVGGLVSLGSGASLMLNANGTFDYDPNGKFESLNTGETATDTFTYTISDPAGETDTATVTVTINGVTDVPTNNPPVAEDDNVSTDEDTAITNGDVFADNGNGIDDDPDGDTLQVSRVNGQATNVGSQINLLSGALLTVNANGMFDYDPNNAFEFLNAGQTDVDSFTYTISDGNGGTDTATVNVTIDGVDDNTPPIAQDDNVSTDEDSGITNGDVFADNGNGVDEDPDGDAITVVEVNGNAADVGTQITLGSGALLTLNADGTFDYDPNGQFESLNTGDTAFDSFDYTIDDGNGGTDSATVSIEITGINERVGDAPVRLSRANRDGWEDAWTNDSIESITHSEDYDTGAPFLNVRFSSSFTDDIRGGDISNGDLGVSGQSIASSVVRQEIDGAEALRFTLVEDAMELTFGVSNFFTDDDGTGFSEAGRVLLLDDQDNVVGEQTFFADNTDGTQEVNVSSQQGFTQAIFTAGAYDTNLEFVFGGYAASNGDFGSNPFTDGGGTHASEYLLDYFEFEFSNTNPLQAPLGVSNDPGDVT